MRYLVVLLSLVFGCFFAPTVHSKTLDFGGISTFTSDGFGVSREVTSPGNLRIADMAEMISALSGELEARGDYHTILAAAPNMIELVPDNIRLRHLYALSLAVSGDTATASAVLDEFPEDADNGVWGTLARAVILRESGILDKAQTLTTDALLHAPNNAYAHNLAGTITFAMNDLEQAVAHFEVAVELQPESGTYLTNLGAIERLLGNIDVAANHLKHALVIEPAACSALINYSGLLRDVGDLAGAQVQLELCLEAEPENIQAIMQNIEVAADRQEYGLALRLVRQHSEKLPEPDTTIARLALLLGDTGLAKSTLATAAPGAGTDLLLAHTAAGGGNLDEAQMLANQLLDRASDRIEIVPFAWGFLATSGKTNLALLHGAQVDPILFTLQGLGAAVNGDEALMRELLVSTQPLIPGLALTGFPEAQITRLVGSSATSWLAAALTHALGGYHRLSHLAAIRATEADPELALAHIVRARAAAELRDGDDMIAALSKALELTPRASAPNLLRGEAAMAMGDLPIAAHHFEQVLEVDDSAGAALRLGLVADRLGDDAKAEAAFERLIKITPRSYIGYNQLAWFLAERERDLDRALSLAWQSNELMPGNASVQDTIGWILFLQGDAAAAVDHLRRSFEITNWEIPGIGLRLAQAELSLGNRDTARELLQVLAERPADDHHGQLARSILEKF